MAPFPDLHSLQVLLHCINASEANRYDKGEVIGEKLGVTRIPSLYLLSELSVYSHQDGDNYDHERTFGWLLMYEEELYTHPVEEEYDEDLTSFLVGVEKNTTNLEYGVLDDIDFDFEF
jgi:hypothetical protein